MLDRAAGKPKQEQTICPDGAFPPSFESSRPKGYMERFVRGNSFSAFLYTAPASPAKQGTCADGEIKACASRASINAQKQADAARINGQKTGCCAVWSAVGLDRPEMMPDNYTPFPETVFGCPVEIAQSY